MRIGVHCFPLKADIGGMKQYFLSLFSELLEHDRENEYVFFHNAKNVATLCELPTSRWRENAVELGKTSRVGRCLKGLDLYFSPLCVLIPRPLPLPTVVMIPDNQEVFYPDFFSQQQKFTREWHYRGSARMADRVLTLSEFSQKSLAGHYGIRGDKIGIASLCADPRFHRAEEIARRPSVLLPEGKFLFYPANRWPHKNHDTLLRALRFLAVERGLKLSLVLTGHDLPGGYQVMQKAAEYGVGDQVFSVGYVAVEELAWLYRNAEMTVFPSLFEGFGLPIVEAMAAGCPVACSHAGSMPEIGGQAVEYFDPESVTDMGAAIERITGNPALRESLISRGHDRAATFSPARLAAAHLQAFREARGAFNPFRYAWNALCYQHYHAWAVGRKYPEQKANSKK